MSDFEQSVVTKSEAETVAFAQEFARSLKRGDAVLLYGDLGMGKSVFSRAVLRSLCGDPDLEVPSPTFTLVQMYDADIETIWHFDLYRLSDVSEIYELGWEDAVAGDTVLVEWPERLGSVLPDAYYAVRIEAVAGQKDYRNIEVTYHG